MEETPFKNNIRFRSIQLRLFWAIHTEHYWIFITYSHNQNLNRHSNQRTIVEPGVVTPRSIELSRGPGWEDIKVRDFGQNTGLWVDVQDTKTRLVVGLVDLLFGNKT